ncbi:MAG: hypothetical protein ACYC65_12455 [Candidatus Limnocylindrales bacterium]
MTITQPDASDQLGDIVYSFDFSGRYRIGEAGTGPTTDPFERRLDGLLLAESFVRLDLHRPRKAREWFLANGVPDLNWFDGYPVVEHGTGRTLLYRDDLRSIETEQFLVRQYMTIVERITLTLPPPAGSGAEWDDEGLEEIHPGPGVPDDDPMAAVRFDLTMDAISEYIMRAMQPEIDLLGSRPPSGRPLFPGARDVAVVPSIRYEWRSIIAPIYLQLYEALRRLSEGRPGARTCAECDQIFLVLDGRRERFCTNAEFARNRQRRYRERQAVRHPAG